MYEADFFVLLGISPDHRRGVLIGEFNFAKGVVC
jgi:hypothetical protein